MKNYMNRDVVTAIDGVVTDTTSSGYQFHEYDYLEMHVKSDVATAWTGTVQVQGSIDGTNYENSGSVITNTAGIYIVDPTPEWVKIVSTRTAGTLTVKLRPVVTQ